MLQRLKTDRLSLQLYPKGWLIFLLTLGAASAICALLRRITPSDVHVPLIFVLAVLIVSLSTEGYFALPRDEKLISLLTQKLPL